MVKRLKPCSLAQILIQILHAFEEGGQTSRQPEPLHILTVGGMDAIDQNRMEVSRPMVFEPSQFQFWQMSSANHFLPLALRIFRFLPQKLRRKLSRKGMTDTIHRTLLYKESQMCTPDAGMSQFLGHFKIFQLPFVGAERQRPKS